MLPLILIAGDPWGWGAMIHGVHDAVTHGVRNAITHGAGLP